MRRLQGLGILALVSVCAVGVIEAEERVRKKIPDKLVVLTFDDCNKSDRTFVAGELRKQGFGATFYVTEGLGFLKNKKHYTTWREIVELHKMGFEIGNHTKSHPHMPSLTKEQMAVEIAERHTVDVEWQRGDVALVNNFLVMHGRRHFAGQRRVLASLIR